jgi:D-glycero-D-manno-heptose 1,7-bisphosphate phosphatase
VRGFHRAFETGRSGEILQKQGDLWLFGKVTQSRRDSCFVGGVKQAVFIERDGVLTAAKVEKQQQVTPLTLEDFRLHEGATPLLKQLKAAGLLLIVTTNQPGLSRGYQSRRELDRMHERLRKVFPLDDILVCPHDETDRCPCRKPKPGLLAEAAFKWHLNLDHSFVISDKWQDAEAARLVGCTSLLLQSPWVGKVHRDFLLPDLAAIVEKILQLRATRRPIAV